MIIEETASIFFHFQKERAKCHNLFLRNLAISAKNTRLTLGRLYASHYAFAQIADYVLIILSLECHRRKVKVRTRNLNLARMSNNICLYSVPEAGCAQTATQGASPARTKTITSVAGNQRSMRIGGLIQGNL
jgi:hypothetical protein